MAPVTLHYWAGARAAAGTEEETLEAETVRRALGLAQAAHDDPRYAGVVAACSLLIDGLAVSTADLDRPLTGPVTVEVLPPFAGGSACFLSHQRVGSARLSGQICDQSHAANGCVEVCPSHLIP